jgi:glycine C-acetyltransferase/8-amino-7-oxononanoate synthase
MPTIPDPRHRRPPVLAPGSGGSLPGRVSGLAAWMQAREASGLAPGEVRLTSGVDAWMEVQEADGRIREGLNFTSCDHLGLCSHREVREAAAGALRRFGPHSAGPAAAAGLHVLAEPLCAGVAELTGLTEVTAMPSGWAAGWGLDGSTLATLGRSGSHPDRSRLDR